MKLIFSLPLIALLGSCALSTEEPVEIIRPVERKEWHNLSKNDVHRVRHPESVRTYYKGRTPGKDRLALEEAHRVYRVENEARWDLRPLKSPLDSPGYPTGLYDETVRPVTGNALVAAEKSRLKAIEGSLVARQVKMQMLIDQLEEARMQQGANVGDLEKLRNDLITERSKRAELAKELAKLKKEQELNAE